MRTAHLQLGSQWFRVRDDLLTPTQLGALGQACTDLPFTPRWSARARFSPQLTHDVLQTARDGGLGELWLGLESASERVRDAMHKGVRDDVVERVLSDCHRLGIRVRALCILGFPGERLSEARQTVRFLLDNAHRLASASLTRFQLMRNSPMVADPDRYGLTVQPDPLPRHERLRFQVPASFADALDDDALAPLIAELSEAIPTAFPDHHGPTLTHAWMRSAP